MILLIYSTIASLPLSNSFLYTRLLLETCYKHESTTIWRSEYFSKYSSILSLNSSLTLNPKYTGYKLQVLLYSIVNLLQKSTIYCCRPRSEDSISTRLDVFQGPAFIYFRKRHTYFLVHSSPQDFNISLGPIVYQSRYHLQFVCIQEKKSSSSSIIRLTPEFIDYSITFAKLFPVTSVYFPLTDVYL